MQLHLTVLPSRSRSHTAHLRETEHDRPEAKVRSHKHPDHAARAAISQAARCGRENDLPGAHGNGDKAQDGGEAEVPAKLLLLAESPHVRLILVGVVRALIFGRFGVGLLYADMVAGFHCVLHFVACCRDAVVGFLAAEARSKAHCAR